ncbi:tetratricopeptide repeat (TPR)-like superfamily protein [Tasmannia lanceolata]|uniref:tetratricopeptide repeat (TPR)-like superfamily protein n=1 Tax=Tasmannia lanceolata TaxID=3420 RepID=UPI0040629CBC
MLENTTCTRFFLKRFLCLDLSDFLCNYSTAVQVFSNSKPRKPTSSNSKSSKFVVFCNSQITKNGRNGNLKEAESVFNRMPSRDVVSWTALLTAYAENGEIAKARQVFDKMPERNTVSWNAMITAYIRKFRIVEASELFSRIPNKNSVSYTAMITGFLEAGMLSEAEKLYTDMPLIWRDPVASNCLISGYLKIGRLEEAVHIFEGMYKRDVVSWSSIVDGYCKKGRIDDARDVLEKMPDRNVVSWTTMVNGYLKYGMWQDGFRAFSRMRKEVMGINSMTLTVIIDACADDLGRLREGTQIHGLVLLMGFECDVFLGNSMITMYSRVGWMDAANRIFYLANKKDLVSWNSLITGYIQNDEIEKAYTLFQNMPERDVVSWTAMVVGFSNRGRIEQSIRLFEDMPEKDDVAWTAIISGFVGNMEYEHAFRWFIKMIREDIKPNSLTLSSMLSASASLAALNQGVQIQAHVVKMDLEYDVSVQNSLVSMYAKCGNVNDAHQIFLSIDKPNLVSMNSMITGFAQHGFGKEALELFRKMQMTGNYEPNEITFLGILSACVHVGFVEEGWTYFKSMNSYCIEPGPDHYVCMVDLLGRAGLLKEAIDLIDAMPFEPHSAIWGALLSASRTHLDLDLAKLAARHLFELEPHSATAYAVLSNMYSIAGLKKDEEELRMIKKSKGVKKNPGCSWIIMNNKVHLFFAGDRSHKEFNEINATLRRIAAEMQKSGR